MGTNCNLSATPFFNTANVFPIFQWHFVQNVPNSLRGSADLICSLAVRVSWSSFISERFNQPFQSICLTTAVTIYGLSMIREPTTVAQSTLSTRGTNETSSPRRLAEWSDFPCTPAAVREQYSGFTQLRL